MTKTPASRAPEPADADGAFKSPLTDLIDDATYGPFDKRKSSLYYEQYFSPGHQARLRAKAKAAELRDLQVNKPGRTLPDVALLAAARSARLYIQAPPDTKEDAAKSPKEPTLCQGPNTPNTRLRSWLPLTDSLVTPEKLGIAPYSASPEAAAATVKQAAVLFGAARVGITGLDPRHLYSHDCDGKAVVREAVELPYETEEKRVIPAKCRWVIVLLLHMPYDAFRGAPDPLGSVVPLVTYTRMEVLLGQMAEFLRALGYTAIPSANDTAPNGPFAVEAGLGEQCRADKIIHPDLGTMIRLGKIFTDLPLALDKPENSGIEAFCKVCDRCIEVCPVKAISTDPEPTFARPGEWVSPGHKTWHGNWPTCWAYAETTGGGCGICLPVCPWNKPNTWPFRMVKNFVKRTARFNRLLVKLDRWLGYGKPLPPGAWWKKKHPTYGIDTRQ